MIVDHPSCLHEGVRGRRADELQAALAQVAGHRHRLRRCGRDVGQGTRPPPGRSRSERPEQGVEALRYGVDDAPRIADRGLDLGAVADDASVGEQALDVMVRRMPRRASMSNAANASRNAGRLRRITSQDSPDWKASKDSRSNSAPIAVQRAVPTRRRGRRRTPALRSPTRSAPDRQAHPGEMRPSPAGAAASRSPPRSRAISASRSRSSSVSRSSSRSVSANR